MLQSNVVDADAEAKCTKRWCWSPMYLVLMLKPKLNVSGNNAAVKSLGTLAEAKCNVLGAYAAVICTLRLCSSPTWLALSLLHNVLVKFSSPYWPKITWSSGVKLTTIIRRSVDDISPNNRRKLDDRPGVCIYRCNTLLFLLQYLVDRTTCCLWKCMTMLISLQCRQ